MLPLYNILYLCYPTHCLAHRNLLDFAITRKSLCTSLFKVHFAQFISCSLCQNIFLKIAHNHFPGHFELHIYCHS